jgi:hypothetical protein
MIASLLAVRANYGPGSTGPAAARDPKHGGESDPRFEPTRQLLPPWGEQLLSELVDTSRICMAGLSASF